MQRNDRKEGEKVALSYKVGKKRNQHRNDENQHFPQKTKNKTIRANMVV